MNSLRIRSLLAAVVVPAFALSALACSNDGQKLQESRLVSFARFGRSLDVSGLTAVVGASQESGVTSDQGAAYVFSRSGETWSVEARLESPTPGDEEFGDSVAISGNTIAVGAPLDDQPGAFRSGSVYIYEKSGTTWSHTATLSSGGTHEAWEAFGHALALDGDTLVVSAVDRDQGSATDAGAVFVFQRSGGVWSLAQTLVGPTPATSDKLGNALDLVGNTLVVAALRRDVAGVTDAGSVYVYTKSGSWTLAQTLSASDRIANDLFGTSVALAQAPSGARRLLVGAEGVDPSNLSSAGAAYVFDAAPAGAFTQAQKLVAADATANAIFGDSVAISGDRLLIGAPGSSVANLQSGAGYVFELSGGTFAQTDELALPSSDPSAFLGGAVALAGNYALLGASGEEVGPNGTDHGTVHAFEKPALGAFLHQHALSAFQYQPGEDFGAHVSVGGDRLTSSAATHADVLVREQRGFSEQQALPSLTGTRWLDASTDGTRVALFGRRSSSASSAPLGYVQVYAFASGAWSLEQQLLPDLVSSALPDESANSAEVAVLGDTLVVGARRWNGGDGRVFVYARSGGSWTQTQLFTSPQAATNFDMNFGNHVRLNGDTLIIAEVPSSGVPMSAQNGNVYVFTRPGAGSNYVQTQVLTEAVPAAGDRFGAGVAIDGDLLAVWSGAAQMLRVYRRSGGTFTQIWSQMIPDVNTLSSFDIGLAMRGDRIVIGAPGATVGSSAAAGELRVLLRQPSDTYTLERVFHANDVKAGAGLGRAVAIDDVRVVGTTAGSDSSSYAFPL